MATVEVDSPPDSPEGTLSTRMTSDYQDPRYLQLWLTFEWPQPTDQVPVACAHCGWTGRRQKRTATRRPCPGCTGRIIRWTGPVRDRSNVVTLTGRVPAGRRVTARRGRAATRG